MALTTSYQGGKPFGSVVNHGSDQKLPRQQPLWEPLSYLLTTPTGTTKAATLPRTSAIDLTTPGGATNHLETYIMALTTPTGGTKVATRLGTSTMALTTPTGAT